MGPVDDMGTKTHKVQKGHFDMKPHLRGRANGNCVATCQRPNTAAEVGQFDAVPSAILAPSHLESIRVVSLPATYDILCAASLVKPGTRRASDWRLSDEGRCHVENAVPQTLHWVSFNIVPGPIHSTANELF